jgi:hypothetical protein
MSDILQQLGLKKEEIIDIIVNRALNLPADYRSNGENSWESIPFHEVIDTKINKAISNLIQESMTAIQIKIDQIVERETSKIFNSPFQPVDRFGAPVGNPTTVKDIIADTIAKYWNVRVNSEGKEVKGYAPSSSYMTRAEFYAIKVTTDFFDKEIVKEIKKMAEEFRNKIPETIGDEISNMVKKHLLK